MSHTITSPLDNGLGLYTSYDTHTKENEAVKDINFSFLSLRVTSLSLYEVYSFRFFVCVCVLKLLFCCRNVI